MASSFSDVEYNYQHICENIARAAQSVGKTADDITFLAATKTVDAPTINHAISLGLRYIGENRVQELLSKYDDYDLDHASLQFIGHLQSNKAARAAELADWIHSVDSEKLVRKLSDAAVKNGKKLKILLEVNVSGEESKYGIRTKEDLFQIAKAAVSAPGIELAGLMTMAPAGAAPETLKNVFSGLRKLKEELQTELSVQLPELSMGMSGDYPAAIAEGATIVRIGTAVFGGRDYSK